MSLLVSKEEFLPTVQSGVREFVGMGMEVLSVDRTATSMGGKQLRTGAVPVDGDVGGDFVAAILRWDLKDIVDTYVAEVFAPPRAWVDVWLRASGHGSASLGFFLLCDAFHLCIYITLHQCIYDLDEVGGRVQRVDLEKLWRGGRHGGDRVSRHYGLVVQPEVVDGGSGYRRDVDVKGVEVGEYLGVDVFSRWGYWECGSVIDRLDLPVLVVGGVLQFGFCCSYTRPRGSGEDGRGVEILHGGDGDGRS